MEIQTTLVESHVIRGTYIFRDSYFSVFCPYGRYGTTRELVGPVHAMARYDIDFSKCFSHDNVENGGL